MSCGPWPEIYNMRRKKFPLESIVKIRNYREFESRKKLLEAKKPIDAVARNISLVKEKKEAAFAEWEKKLHPPGSKDSPSLSVLPISDLLHLQKFVSECVQEENVLSEKKKNLINEIKEQRDAYQQARKEQEAIRILRKKFESRQKREKQKDQNKELLEKILC